MEIVFDEVAKKNLIFWKKSGNKVVQNKIQAIIQSIIISSYEGIGKPEPLKYALTGKLSRRINKEHRIIYEVLLDKKLPKSIH